MKKKTKELDNMAMTILQQTRKGAVIDDFSATIRETVAAVKEAGKKGKVVLTIDISPKDGDTEQVEVSAVVTCKKPKLPSGAAIFYVNDENGLQREDPSGPGLFEATEFDERNRETAWKPAVGGEA